MDRNLKLNFHQTFYANLDYVAKILRIADGVSKYSIEDISDLTGIPTGKSSGKIVPHILYAQYMNLIKYVLLQGKYTFKRTDFGEEVMKHDEYLSENVTRLLCHYFLTSKCFGATQWFMMFRIAQLKYGKELKTNVLIGEAESSFRKKINPTPFNGCYTNNSSFACLNLLNVADNYYKFEEFENHQEYYYAILYCLFRDAEQFDPTRIEFTENEILETLLWQKAFNWSHQQAILFIEKANHDGIVILNRQLSPMTIVLNTTSEILQRKLYSLLI